MYRFFIASGQISEGILRVTGEDVNHIKNVLRMKQGEDIEAVDENGLVTTARIKSLTADEILAGVLFSEPSGAELPNKITLFMGLPKFDKMELIIQKAVELGVSEIVPVTTRRTVVKLDAKKETSKRARWQAIAESAAKQAKRSYIPSVGEVKTFSKALEEARKMDTVLLPYECADNIEKTRAILGDIKSGESIGVFIGPEGGFEKEEAEAAGKAGAKIITLGKRILRTETAAIAILAVLMIGLEKN